MPRGSAKHHKKTVRRAHATRSAKPPKIARRTGPKEPTEQRMISAPNPEKEPLTVFFERVEMASEPRTVEVVEVEDWPV